MRRILAILSPFRADATRTVHAPLQRGRLFVQRGLMQGLAFGVSPPPRHTAPLQQPGGIRAVGVATTRACSACSLPQVSMAFLPSSGVIFATRRFSSCRTASAPRQRRCRGHAGRRRWFFSPAVWFGHPNGHTRAERAGPSPTNEKTPGRSSPSRQAKKRFGTRIGAEANPLPC